MLDQIGNKGAGEIDREHLDLKGRFKLGALGHEGAIGCAEFARAVDCSCAHEVADFGKLGGIGL